MSVTMTMRSLLILLLSIECCLAVTYCPPYWTHFRLEDETIFCYRFFGKKVTWAEAEITCAGYSSCEGEELAHLVSLTGPEEEMFIIDYRQSVTGIFGGGDPGMWIGFSDRRNEGTWKWADKSTSTYTNWYSANNEPSDTVHVENCARQIVPMMGVAVWVDVSCSEKQSFMCKMPAQ
ncbi:echinoidin-like [Diadema setosum]|uniref:echinoidin-like n=1 Tax=Diadema setosum TaxID=31175 RepID=UPI003B3A0F09